MQLIEDFPGGSDGKESACSAGDLGSIPGLGRSPGEGHGNPLQYSCLENSVDRGAWLVIVHEVVKSRTWLSDFHFTSQRGKQGERENRVSSWGGGASKRKHPYLSPRMWKSMCPVSFSTLVRWLWHQSHIWAREPVEGRPPGPMTYSWGDPGARTPTTLCSLPVILLNSHRCYLHLLSTDPVGPE